MSRRSVDANVLLRLVRGDIPDQQDQAKRLLGAPEASFHVSAATWVEVAYVLGEFYEVPRKDIATTLTLLTAIPSLSAHANLIEATVGPWIRHPKLSFTDCLVAAEAAMVDAQPLFTFDKKLARQHPDAAAVP
ncbi:MAG: PIN domain-containing protein [Cellulomonadaceae bacterium]|jgi:predicted nucleic acid-binding protein|nr:PIN domain-containing protein [Cellulomonadaceae bacterium]